MPGISVCIPTYNGARYLADAIDSVLRQDCGDFELIVCDNASTDDTPVLCARYLDPRMRYVRFEQLVGQAANWNRCLELGTSEYLVLLHADDVLRPAYLGRAASVLASNPGVSLAHCSVQHIDEAGTPVFLKRLYDEPKVVPGDAFLKRLLVEGCLISPAGVMVRRRAYQAAGRFVEHVVWGVDWNMWMRIALQGDVAYVPETLALYREHSSSGTAAVSASARNGRDELWALEDVLARIPRSRTDLHALRPEAVRQVAHRTWCHAEFACRRGFGRAARAGLRSALSIRPSMILEGRVWGLWVASFLGYPFFQRLHGLKHRMSPGAWAPRNGA
jgi:glycosyltransferase involved in cell wall biosynthesis